MTETVSMPAKLKSSPRVWVHLQGIPWEWHLGWHRYPVQIAFSKTLSLFKDCQKGPPLPIHFSLSSHWKRRQSMDPFPVSVLFLLFTMLMYRPVVLLGELQSREKLVQRAKQLLLPRRPSSFQPESLCCPFSDHSTRGLSSSSKLTAMRLQLSSFL